MEVLEFLLYILIVVLPVFVFLGKIPDIKENAEWYLGDDATWGEAFKNTWKYPEFYLRRSHRGIHVKARPLLVRQLQFCCKTYSKLSKVPAIFDTPDFQKEHRIQLKILARILTDICQASTWDESHDRIIVYRAVDDYVNKSSAICNRACARRKEQQEARREQRRKQYKGADRVWKLRQRLARHLRTWLR